MCVAVESMDANLDHDDARNQRGELTLRGSRRGWAVGSVEKAPKLLRLAQTRDLSMIVAVKRFGRPARSPVRKLVSASASLAVAACRDLKPREFMRTQLACVVRQTMI